MKKFSFFTGGLFSTASEPGPNLASGVSGSIAAGVSGASLENTVRSVLLKLLRDLNSKRYRQCRQELSDCVALLDSIVQSYINDVEAVSEAPLTGKLDAVDNVEEGADRLTLLLPQRVPTVPKKVVSLNARIHKAATQFFEPFVNILSLKVSRASICALDGLQKLLSCGLFSGNILPQNSPAWESLYSSSAVFQALDDDDELGTSVLRGTPLFSQLYLADAAVLLVLRCLSTAEDDTQVHVIRCLLTAATSTQCGDLRPASVLLTVKALFRLCQRSRAAATLRAAPAALTQIVDVSVRKLEHNRLALLPGEAEAVQEASAGSPDDLENSTHLERFEIRLKSYVDTRVEHMVAEIASEGTDDYGMHGCCVVCHAAAPQFCLQSMEPLCSFECKATNLRRIKLLEEAEAAVHFVRSPPAAPPPDSSPASLSEVRLTGPERPSHSRTRRGNRSPNNGLFVRPLSPRSRHNSWHRGIILGLLKLLCAISMADSVPPGAVSGTMGPLATLTAGPVGMAPPAASSNLSGERVSRCTALALRLILAMMECSGTQFKSDIAVLEAIKNELCLSVIKNAVSPVPSISGPSLEIFLCMVFNLKNQMVTEIGVMMDQTLLRILMSPNSSFDQKEAILKALSRICKDPRVALELYLNFDTCNIFESDVFKRLVRCLAETASGRSTGTPGSLSSGEAQERQFLLRRTSFQSLIDLLESLLLWVQKCQAAEPSKPESGQKSAIHNNADTIGADRGSPASGLVALTKDSFSSEISSYPSNQSAEVMRRRMQKLEFLETVKLFNEKPRKGLEQLCAKNYVDSDPTSIAAFFLRCSELSKKAIGDYLGDVNELSQRVLTEFVNQLDFVGLDIDFAVRKFLSAFRLPGEAQKIDRMMEQFAAKYTRDNPGVFQTEDCAYVLAFSLIMLHTDAHSRHIKPENKMSLENFVKQNRNINAASDLPPQFLETLYRRVVAEEWVMEEDAGVSSNQPQQQQQLHQLESLAIALGFVSPSATRRKLELYMKESLGIVTRSTELLRRHRTAFSQKRDNAQGISPNSVSNTSSFASMRKSHDLEQPSVYQNSSNQMEKSPSQSDPDLSSAAFFVTAVPELADQVSFLFQDVAVIIFESLSIVGRTLDAAPSGHASNVLSPMGDLVLRGYAAAVKLAHHFKLAPEGARYIDGLAALTALNKVTDEPFTGLLSKNALAATNLLLRLALTEGDVFDWAWKSALSVISRMHLVLFPDEDAVVAAVPGLPPAALSPIRRKPTSPSRQSSNKPPATATAPEAAEGTSGSGPITADGSASGSILPPTGVNIPPPPTLEERIAELLGSNVDITLPDLVFARSNELSTASFVPFVAALCDVSAQELALQRTPRVFALRKIVEIADYNLTRIRFVWAQVWTLIRAHFVASAQHPSLPVCLYAVDSLRQLANKFLEREAAASPALQADVLRPLHVLMADSKTAEPVREFVLQTTVNMMQARGNELQNGWRVLFAVLTAATTLHNDVLDTAVLGRLTTALHAVEDILRKFFWITFQNFDLLVRSLCAFATISVDKRFGSRGVPQINAIAKKAMNLLEAVAITIAGEDYTTEINEIVDILLSASERKRFIHGAFQIPGIQTELAKATPPMLLSPESSMPAQRLSMAVSMDRRESPPNESPTALDQGLRLETVSHNKSFGAGEQERGNLFELPRESLRFSQNNMGCSRDTNNISSDTDHAQTLMSGSEKDEKSLDASKGPLEVKGPTEIRVYKKKNLLRGKSSTSPQKRHTPHSTTSARRSIAQRNMGDETTRLETDPQVHQTLLKELHDAVSKTSDHHLVSEISDLPKIVDLVRVLRARVGEHWFAIFTGLSQVASRSTNSTAARVAALQTLFRLLNRWGPFYLTSDLWVMTIRGVLAPLFDELHLQAQHESTDVSGDEPSEVSPKNASLFPSPEDATTELSGAVRGSAPTASPLPLPPPATQAASTASIFKDSFDTYQTAEYKEALRLLVVLLDEQFSTIDCIRDAPECVARLALDALRAIVIRVGPRCEAADWVAITDGVIVLFEETAPRSLLCPVPDNGPPNEPESPSSFYSNITTLPFDPETVVTQCVVQLCLIELVDQAIRPLLNLIPPDSVDKLLVAVKNTFALARTFNRQVIWRGKVKRMGFLRELRQLPGLLKQEREGLGLYFRCLYTLLLQSNPDDDRIEQKAEMYSDLVKSVTDQYLERQPASPSGIPPEGPKTLAQLVLLEKEREHAGVTPILLNIVLPKMQQLPPHVFRKISADLYLVLTNLILCDSKNIRRDVRRILQKLFAPPRPPPAPPASS